MRHVLIVIAVVTLLGVGGRTATAQVATPTMGSTSVYPYQLVLTGPTAAVPAETLAYVLAFEQIDAATTEGVSFNLVLPASMAFVSAAAPAGATCAANPPPQPPVRTTVRCDGGSGSGSYQFTIRTADAFSGDAVVGIDVLGSGIQLPAGSQTSVTTHVAASAPTMEAAATMASPPASSTARVALPSTGAHRDEAGSSWVWPTVAALLGGGAAVAAGLTRRPR